MGFIIHAIDGTVTMTLLIVALSDASIAALAFLALFVYQQLRTALVFRFDTGNCNKQTNPVLFGLFDLFSILGVCISIFTHTLSSALVISFALTFGIASLLKYSSLLVFNHYGLQRDPEMPIQSASSKPRNSEESPRLA